MNIHYVFSYYNCKSFCKSKTLYFMSNLKIFEQYEVDNKNMKYMYFIDLLFYCSTLK